nr:TetR/AcrR family transcriptional regulator C-terminal domain-containing protein [Clostridium botulinum]
MEYFNYYAEYNEKMGIDMMKQLYNSNNKMFITKGRHMQTVLDIIIEQGQKNNEVTTEMTPKQITKFLFVLMRGIVYDWCLHDGEYDLKEKMKSMLMQILKTIKP